MEAAAEAYGKMMPTERLESGGRVFGLAMVGP
jgi:hypothetical protein